MTNLIDISRLKKCMISIAIFSGYFIFLAFYIVKGDIILAADDFINMIEDFEGTFEDAPGYGSIPSDWLVVIISYNQTVFSKGNESHHGQYGLHAEVEHDPTFYTTLRTVLVEQPGAVIDLQIQAKASTGTTGKARLLTYGGATGNITQSVTQYWYSNSSTDWISIVLEEVEIPSDGELSISLQVHHDTSSGSTVFDFDCLTYREHSSNRPPVLDPIGAKTANENELLEFTVTASDPDYDDLSYTASNLPGGATFVDQEFSWIPGSGDEGNYTVEFTVTDDGSPPLSDSETVIISVGGENHPPVLDPIGAKTANENELLEFTVTASDPDYDDLSYTASNLPGGATFVDQEFSWIPGSGDEGNYTVEFTVTDDGSPPLKDTETVTIIVTGPSDENDDLVYIIDDFEGAFENVTGFGSIPSGWSVSGPQKAIFSKGTGAHHGQSGLHAEVTHDPTYNTVLEALLLGQPGDIVDLQIQAKVTTSGTALASFDAEAQTREGNWGTTSYWYNETSEWRSMTLEKIEIPSNGELPISLGVAQTTVSGSTYFDFDCLTSNVPLTIVGVDSKDPGSDDDIDEDAGDDAKDSSVGGGGGGGGGCFFSVL
jgi:hypothetical protein